MATISPLFFNFPLPSQKMSEIARKRTDLQFIRLSLEAPLLHPRMQSFWLMSVLIYPLWLLMTKNDRYHVWGWKKSSKLRPLHICYKQIRARSTYNIPWFQVLQSFWSWIFGSIQWDMNVGHGRKVKMNIGEMGCLSSLSVYAVVM